MKSIENKYNEDKSVKEIVDKLNKYKHNSIIASEKLTWSREKQTLTGIYSQFN